MDISRDIIPGHPHVDHMKVKDLSAEKYGYLSFGMEKSLILSIKLYIALLVHPTNASLDRRY